MFVSHQWAGIGHPDPGMKQFRVLQDALRGFLHGGTDVPASISVEMFVGDREKITGAEISSKPLFVWYDYFSCPQAVDEARHRQLAIISDQVASLKSSRKLSQFLIAKSYSQGIPAYIERCRYFAILCPHVQHEDHDKLLSKHTWAERGLPTS